jgi:hypothetical protein
MGDTCSTNGEDVNRKIRTQGLWRCKCTEAVTSGGVPDSIGNEKYIHQLHDYQILLHVTQIVLNEVSHGFSLASACKFRDSTSYYA